jgi:hypothetical protein
VPGRVQKSVSLKRRLMERRLVLQVAWPMGAL